MMNLKKPAFTMIELVFVIVILVILAAMDIPSFDRDLRQGAKDNILAAISLTQHIALIDNITDPAKTFTSLADLESIAVSSGFGLRYDFGFFVFRLDIGFKTYDPAYPKGNRWFTDYNFGNAVYNIGINYPF